MRNCTSNSLARTATIALTLGLGWAVSTPLAYAQGKFFDWSLRENTPNSSPYIAAPHPGSDWPANWSGYQSLFANRTTAGLSNSFVLSNSQTPPASPTLDTVLSWSQNVGYVFGEFEQGATADETAMTAMRQKVRAHPNANVNGAYLGNFPYAPGTNDPAMHFPWLTDTTARNNAYINSGMNIAMPDCYPYAYQNQHATGVWPANNRSLNERDALFWAPLEHLSVAKRSLPAGHLLIPWVAVYVPWDGYVSAIPTKEDHLALIQHFRLRGADGFFRLYTTDKNAQYSSAMPSYAGQYMVPRSSWLINYTEEQHRTDIVNVWNDLNTLWANGPVTLLNLSTSKTTGVNWSGARGGNTVKILVSNLSGTGAKTADWSSIEFNGVPATSPSVSDGTHTWFTYTISNLLTAQNSDFDAGTGDWYLRGGLRQTSGGTSNSPCVKLQNYVYAASLNTPLRVEPGAAMQVQLAVKGASSPTLRLGFYTLDANKNYISDFSGPTWANLGSTWTTLNGTFTVPSNSNIRYIQPILYNVNGESDPSDTIWLDDLTLKFG